MVALVCKVLFNWGHRLYSRCTAIPYPGIHISVPCTPTLACSDMAVSAHMQTGRWRHLTTGAIARRKSPSELASLGLPELCFYIVLYASVFFAASCCPPGIAAHISLKKNSSALSRAGPVSVSPFFFSVTTGCHGYVQRFTFYLSTRGWPRCYPIVRGSHPALLAVYQHHDPR